MYKESWGTWGRVPLGGNIFSLLFSPSLLCSSSWTCLWLSSPAPLALLCVKPFTCTLVTPICPRSASCSPIITPFKAPHPRNPADRPKLFVTPPEGSARRRTTHGLAVSSVWRSWCLGVGSVSVQSGLCPKVCSGHKIRWLWHTSPPILNPAGCALQPITASPLGGLLLPIHLNLRMKLFFAWVQLCGKSVPLGHLCKQVVRILFESQKPSRLCREVGLSCCPDHLSQPFPETGFAL